MRPSAPPPLLTARPTAWGASRWRRCLLPLAVILVLTTWPWQFENHSHWSRVEWVPFTTYRRPADWLANLGLFIPFGAAWTWGGATRRQVRQAVLLGVAVSCAVEVTQVFTHGRAPTVADVLANGLGTWAGARWAMARARRAGPSGDDRGAPPDGRSVPAAGG